MTSQTHKAFKKPDDQDVKIWRYMSISKFLWMLQKNALYFARSDHLGDPFEGHYPRANLSLEEVFVANQKEDPGLANVDVRAHFKILFESVKHEKAQLFVNCWHMNEQESLAMWKLYSSQHESVCIQSTFRKLEQLLPPEAFIGTVKYIDYDIDLVNMANSLNYIVHKRRSFEHERELRAVMWKPTARDKFALVAERGMIVPTRVADLIENIFVSPTADPILEEVVNGLKETYALLAPVHKSSVNLGPDY